MRVVVWRRWAGGQEKASTLLQTRVVMGIKPTQRSPISRASGKSIKNDGNFLMYF